MADKIAILAEQYKDLAIDDIQNCLEKHKGNLDKASAHLLTTEYETERQVRSSFSNNSKNSLQSFCGNLTVSKQLGLGEAVVIVNTAIIL